MKFVAFDVETRSSRISGALEPFRARTGEAWLTSAAIADAEPRYILKPTVEQLREWLLDCRAKGLTICGWYVQFDMAWLIALGLREEVYANNWIDGMHLLKHLTARPKWLPGGPSDHSLKTAVAEMWPDQAGYEKGIDFEADTPEGQLQLAVYNLKDSTFTRSLVCHYWLQMSKSQRRAALLEAQCLPMVAEAMVEGIKIDDEAATQLFFRLDEDAKIALVKLKLQTREDIDPDIIASPAKLRKLLYTDWKLPQVKFTPTGAASTDRDVLSQLAHEDERAWLLNQYREATNNRTKFAMGAKLSSSHNGDGFSRPYPQVAGTYTGRMSYRSKVGRGKEEVPTGVALHQWKRDPAFRNLIQAPDGYTLIELDFAGQEYRWMAYMSGDPTMLGLCDLDKDAHGYMAKQIGVNADRQLGKVANLSLQYRTSARTLTRVARLPPYNLKLSLSEAETLHRAFRRTYPMVPRYWKDAINRGRINGYAETVAGRRVQLGMGNTWDTQGLKWGLESTAINTPIQGSGADQKYLALAVAKDYLPTVSGRFYFELHDGLFFIVPTDKAERAVVELTQLLSNLPYKKAWGVNLPIPFPVDAKWGLTWGQLRKYG